MNKVIVGKNDPYYIAVYRDGFQGVVVQVIKESVGKIYNEALGEYQVHKNQDVIWSRIASVNDETDNPKLTIKDITKNFIQAARSFLAGVIENSNKIDGVLLDLNSQYGELNKDEQEQ